MDAYENWLEEVCYEVERRVGIGIHDLEDCRLREWFDSEIDPPEAAEMALDNDTLYSQYWRI